MIIRLNTTSATPIYIQLRNQIVTGIGKGELKVGEKLPTVRQLAADAGVNTMTVNKAYQLLRAEGFIEIDRRSGATVQPARDDSDRYRSRLESELELLSAEASIRGWDKGTFLKICESVYGRMEPAGMEG